ncbi:MAG: hypothetical protein FJ146_07970 [Deltaproteobacteria bacterium]|nr:hypothetical protein [Deltaproteobacteria bacterium]
MKRSTWRFKRSRFSDPSFVRHDLPFLCTMATILIVASCQLSRRSDGEPSQIATEGGGLSLSAASAPLRVKPPLMPEDPTPLNPQLMISVTRQIGSHTHVPYYARVPDCTASPEASVVQFFTILKSDFGQHPIQLILRGEGLGEAIRVDAENYRMSFAVTAPVKSALVKQICGATKDGSPHITPEPSIMAETETWLRHIAPDCTEIQPVLDSSDARMVSNEYLRPGQWYCQLPEATPTNALAELDTIRTTMIRRWTRQPYLLARRLAVGADLAHALMAKDPERGLDVFCRVVKGSLPAELPATLTSKRWQYAVCDHPDDHRIHAARFGLLKTVSEVSFMRQLFDRTSRLGYLTLKLPIPEQAGRDVLVTLAPLGEVTDNVARETTKIWLGEETKGKVNLDAESPRSCWHPIYGEDAGLMRLARYLTLSGQTLKVACEESDPIRENSLTPARYFAESITSETEFVATNGHAKMLRLPIGRYAYKLRILPENLEDWDDASQVAEGARGEIEWDAKRPRQVISQW